ncbi:MAG TPA: methyltransferase domain-containing protein [Candidatus Acidoferrales bacterium]|nr:methyltransferase domain-containing protein [Candidatus Acidoferrales bacterium]
MEIAANTAGGADATEGAAARERAVAADYGEGYYANYAAGDVVYERNAHWQGFFGSIADRLIADFAPKTALDAGCAIGLLVEALRDRGVDAEGIDFSEFAIARARVDIRPHLTIGSITDAFQRRYDLITCFEVLEHLSMPDADKAIANLCAFTDDLIVSSTPMHYRDPTHTNIHPQEYWTERFARHGFLRDVDYDANYIAPWAARYHRSSAPIHRVVAEYDRAYARMRFELQERNAVVMEQMREIEALRARLDDLESRAGWSKRPVARIARRADDLAIRAAPQGTMRHDLLRSAYHGLQRLLRRRTHD